MKSEPDPILPVALTDVDDIGKQGDIYIAMGYPAKKNEKLDLVKKTFMRRPACYTANVLPDDKLSVIGVHRGSHLLLAFKKRHSRDATGRDTSEESLQSHVGRRGLNSRMI